MAPTVPITELDPIVDSQLLQPHTKGGKIQRLGAQAGRMQGSSHAQRSGSRVTAVSKVNRDGAQRSARIIKKVRTAVPPKANHPVSNRTKQHSLGCIRFVADGFVGAELDIVPVRKALQRKNAVTRKPKLHVTVSGLVLASGLLPTPALESRHSSGVSPSLRHLPTNKPPSHLTRHDAIRLPLVLTQGAKSVKEIREESAEHQQRAVHDQLSRITAPRRGSESSGSDSVAEEQSMEGEDNDSNDGQHQPAEAAHSTPLSRRSTLVEDHRYFESAMYHLDEEREHGLAIEELLFR